MPLPTKCSFSIEPPQVDPAIATSTGLGTVLRVAGNQRVIAVQQHRGIAVVLSVNLKYGGRRKILQEHASLNFGLNDVAIYLIAEVGVWRKQRQWLNQGSPSG